MINPQSTVPADRQEKILQYIRQHGSCQIKTLAALLDVSEATVRRDLDDMDSAGYLKRTHGGAIYNNMGTSFERRYEEKLTLMEAEKRAIAAEAVKHISPGDTIVLDSGSTTYYLGNVLGSIPNLTILTYDMMVAHSAATHPSSTVIVSGGIRRQGYNNVLIGNQVISFLRKMRVDKFFLAADAVDLEFGVSNSTLQEAEIKAQAIASSDKVILIADSTKFNKVALSQVCELNAIDTLITDNKADSSILQQLKKNIHQVITV